MALIDFKKEQLINLEFSLSKELLRTNRAGCFANTTIIGCNTRKYHGLLICPLENIDGENHVLLSGVDISILQHDTSFNLAVRKYPDGIYDPKGHKYAREFVVDKTPKLIYRVGGVVLETELILSSDDRILLKYTLLDAHSDTKLRFKPFLAFRNIHKLSKANFFVNKNYDKCDNGIKIRMYDKYPELFMQINKFNDYVHAPDWYYNVEYQEEQKRGYEFQEDLYVPGYFEVRIEKGESIIFTAGLEELKSNEITEKYNTQIANRQDRSSFLDCLKVAASQFLCKRNGKTEIIAGFPWFGRWGRDTFISLPGLTLYNNDVKTCKDVLDTMTSEINNGLFPNTGHGQNIALNSVDAPLWFFWALQHYSYFIENKNEIWKNYGEKMKNILEKYREGTHFNIKMHENGLIWAGVPEKALTWMDAVVDGKPVTPRMGFCVEINALWYNAVCFSIEMAKIAEDNEFVERWKDIPKITKKTFNNYFWNEQTNSLFDCVTYDFKDRSIRPNQIIACSLEYSVLDDEHLGKVVEFVRSRLLTPKGLRTLPADSQNYIGIYEGNQAERDNAYHQGTVWVWLLGHFCEAYLKIRGKTGLNRVEAILKKFEEDITTYGIATIPEIYDGDPPHNPKGCISQAWSVAELLRINHLIETYKK